MVRGYPPDIILDAESRAVLRDTLFKRTQQDSNRLNWAIDYSPKAMAISHIIKKHWHLISDVSGCELPPQIGF